MIRLKIFRVVERTARKRLDGGSDGDMAMTDAAVDPTTPAISDLEIADRAPPSTPKRHVLPAVTFSFSGKESPSKTNRIEEGRSSIEPYDPDPFLNPDLDNLRSRSRRSSLAPPPPEGPSQPARSEPQSVATSGLIRSRSFGPSPFTAKHPTTPPEQQILAKRPRRVQRTASQFSKGALPDHLLVRVFRQLKIRELMRLRRVSVHWSRILSSSPDLLRVLDLREYNRQITDKLLVDTICPFVGARPVVIDISNCFHVTDEGFIALATTCGANVRVWRMRSVWDITPQAVLEMANRAKELEEVDLSNCRKVSDNLLARVVGWVVPESPISPPHPHQQTQMMNGRHRASSMRSNYPPPQQQQQQQQQQQAVVQQTPPGTVIGCPKLKRITLSYCKHVTDRSMAHLAVHAASRLESIDLTRCTTITDNGFQHWSIYQFSRLQRLCLADCTYLTDNAIVYLTNAAKCLKELDLVSAIHPPVPILILPPPNNHTLNNLLNRYANDWYLMNIQSFCCALSDTATEVLSLGCPQLVSLKLSFCGSAVSDSSLRSIGLHLLDLQELSVRGCVRVTGVGVEAVVEGCHRLTMFDVSQCKNLQRWLDAGGIQRCRKVWKRNVRFEVVAGDGGMGVDHGGDVVVGGSGGRKSVGAVGGGVVGGGGGRAKGDGVGMGIGGSSLLAAAAAFRGARSQTF